MQTNEPLKVGMWYWERSRTYLQQLQTRRWCRLFL